MPPSPSARPLRRFLRRASAALVPVLAVAAFSAFTAFLVLRLREGFDRRVADEAAETTEEPEDVVSRAIEFTLDEQGEPLLRVVAEEATGRSDGVQRFLGVSARFFETWEGGDSEIAADELLLDAAGGSLQFLGNARLTTEGLELGGPYLRFRRTPDQLWSNEVVQFATEDFFGVALSFRFHLESREVHLRGVAVTPSGGEGVSAAAESAVFDPETGDTTLFGEVEMASDEVILTSRENVVLRRDPELGRIVAVEAGFGSRLLLAARAPEAASEAAGAAEAPRADEEGAEGAPGSAASEEEAAVDGGEERTAGAAAPVLHGDFVRIEIGEGRRPRSIAVEQGPLLRTPDGAELRGDRAEVRFADSGEEEGRRGHTIRFTGDVRTEVLTRGPDERIVRVESDRAEISLDAGGDPERGQFRGGIRVDAGGARAFAEMAYWDGDSTLALGGSPRVEDSALLDLEARQIIVVIGEATAIEASGRVAARFSVSRLSWLPGEFESAGLFAEAARMESGSGRALFEGEVRLLFGGSRFESEELELDAEERVLVAAGAVRSAMEIGLDRGGAGGGGDSAVGDGVNGDGSGGEGPAGEGPAGEGPAGEGGPGAARFTARAERFDFRAAEGRMRWSGTPSLEVTLGDEGEAPTRVTAGEVSAELTESGALTALVGDHAARFERSGQRADGRRIRYRPEEGILEAWGAPATVTADGRSSEGGRLRIEFDGARSEAEASRARRASARSRRNRGTGR